MNNPSNLNVERLPSDIAKSVQNEREKETSQPNRYLFLEEVEKKEYSSEKLDIYRKTAEINWQKSEKARKNRLKKAWKLIQVANVLLKEKFGATKVIIFGSILNENCFTQWSDVDIAVEGLAPTDTFKAMGMVRELSDKIELNLVDMNACSMSLKQRILQDGKEI